MAQPDVYQAQDVIQKSIGYIVYENKKDLIALLRKNGVKVEDNVSDKDLIRMTYLAIAKSMQFKKDFAHYLESHSQSSNEVSNYVGVNEKKQAKKQAKVSARVTETNPSGKTKVGQLLGNLATPENIQSVINTGLGVLSQKLTAKADQKSISQATELASAQSEQAKLEAEAADKKAKALKSWIFPVVIGAVVLGGIGLFFYIKKRKKA